MAKHLKLQYSENLAVYIIGIVSSANHLKLSWALNQALNIQLSVKDKVALTNSKTGNNTEHTLFQYENESCSLKYSLISNKVGSIYFIDELKNIDYLFIIKGEPNSSEKEQMNQTLRNISEIATFINIQQGTIKKRERLELI